MEDAYEIGIRLVLENGVATGIAALQHDLAVYERALAATTGRVRTTVQAGRELAAPVGPGGPGPAAREPVTGGQTDFPDIGEGRRLEVPVPAAMVPAPAVLPMPAAMVPPPAVLPMQAAADPALAMPQAALVRTIRDPPDSSPRLPVAPEHPVRAAMGEPQGAAISDRGPAMIAMTMTALPPPRFERYAPTLLTSQLPVTVAPDGPGSGPVSKPAAGQSEDQQAPVAVRELFRPSGWNALPPSAEPASTSQQAPARPASTSAALAPPAAPVAATASSGPAQGDVYLDGARVGRWMSDRLAREVDRPQTGVTGFDPRLGPAWPGSLHGT
jgi:hypothetical protein